MPNGERVVLRTPWSVAVSNVAIFLPLFLVHVILDQSLQALVMFSAGCVALAAVALVHRYQFRTVLTPEGVVIRRVRSRLVPWNHIGAVRREYLLGTGDVTVWDVTENRTRHLSAPRSFFRVGLGQVDAAHALVEPWWIANRGPAPAVNPVGRTPPGAAGR